MTSKTISSSQDMLIWQYRALIGELSQVTLHAISDDCPCNQVELTPPEYCLAKHLLNVSSLAAETCLMDEANADMLKELASEATEQHEKARGIYCKGGEWPNLAPWSRDWRKKIEGIYYACGVSLQDTAEPMVRISGKCKGKVDSTCQFTVKREGKAEKVEGVQPMIESAGRLLEEELVGPKVMPLTVELAGQTFRFAPETVQKMARIADAAAKREKGFYFCEGAGGLLRPGKLCTGEACSITIKDCAPKRSRGTFHTHPSPDEWKQRHLSVGDLVNTTGQITCMGGHLAADIQCAVQKQPEQPVPVPPELHAYAFIHPRAPEEVKERIRGLKDWLFFPKVGESFEYVEFPKNLYKGGDMEPPTLPGLKPKPKPKPKPKEGL